MPQEQGRKFAGHKVEVIAALVTREVVVAFEESYSYAYMQQWNHIAPILIEVLDAVSEFISKPSGAPVSVCFLFTSATASSHELEGKRSKGKYKRRFVFSE